MLTIRGEHGSAPDGNDHLFLMKLRDTHLLRETLHGACEDDCEITAPYIGMCPDESTHPGGSPLNFGGVSHTEYDAHARDFGEMLRRGFEFSTTTTIAAYRHEHGRNESTGDPIEESVDPDDPNFWA